MLTFFAGRYLALAFQKKIPPKSPWDLIMNLHYDHSMMQVCKPLLSLPGTLFSNLNPFDRFWQVVSHDLYERAFMIQSAPFMTHPLPMMIPIKHYWEIPMMWISGESRFLATSCSL